MFLRLPKLMKKEERKMYLNLVLTFRISHLVAISAIIKNIIEVHQSP